MFLSSIQRQSDSEETSSEEDSDDEEGSEEESEEEETSSEEDKPIKAKPQAAAKKDKQKKKVSNGLQVEAKDSSLLDLEDCELNNIMWWCVDVMSSLCRGGTCSLNTGGISYHGNC